MFMRVKPSFSLFSIFLFVGFAFNPSLVKAQTAPSLSTEASRMDSLAASQGQNKVVDKISGEFSSFLGGDSRAVVLGLRNGTPINLTTTTPSPTGGLPVTTTTTITPPTGKMGFGNVFISLALAKQQLSQVGITQPTPSQLQAALLGGSITTGTGTAATTSNFPGILTLRNEGMGWGQIAHRLNMNLGKVASGLKASNSALAATSTSPTGSGVVNASGQSVSSSENGVVTGSGKSLGKVGKGTLGRGEAGDGIVTGSGRSVGTEGGIVTGRGNAYGVSGGSPGDGQAKGHDK
jgi:hypothetical protein